MNPENLFYTREHEWVRIEKEFAIIGITDYAQNLLGEITFIELGLIGQELQPNGVAASVESAKAASDVYSPLAGRIVAVNDKLETQPELINQDCYGAGWIVKLQITDNAHRENLMSADDYDNYVKEL